MTTATAIAPDYFATPERIAETKRARELARLDAYQRGTQYKGRPDFFTGEDGKGNVVPLRERAPHVIYPLPRACCQQATRFTFGDGRFPTIEVAATQRTEDGEDGKPVEIIDAAVPELAISDDEAELLTAYVADVIESARLKSAMRTLLRHGLAQRTAVAVLSVRHGRFKLDMPRAGDCWPEFRDGDPDEDVVRMVWCYPFSKPVQKGQTIVEEQFLFRRDFTETEVVFYEDAPFKPGRAVEWTRDEERTKEHGLGFCPVAWMRNLPEPSCEEIDGTALCDGLEDEFDELNFALSQRARGIRYFGSPQAWEAGVSDDEQPGALGRTSRPVRGEAPGQRAADPYVKSGTRPARKKAPDEIWSFQSDTAKVGVMETTGKAFEVATAHVLDIRARILEAIDVVLLDPKEAAGRGEISGTALARLYAPLLALVDDLRECWWSTGLRKLLSMILRATASLGGRGIFVPNAARVAAVCKRFTLKHEAGEEWITPKMIPSWGAYFSPSASDIGDMVTATVAAKDGGLISPTTGTRQVAPYFGVTDIESECEEAEGASPGKALDRLEAGMADGAVMPPATPMQQGEQPEDGAPEGETDGADQEASPPAQPPPPKPVPRKATAKAPPPAPKPAVKSKPVQPKPKAKAKAKPKRPVDAQAVALPKGKLLGKRAA